MGDKVFFMTMNQSAFGENPAIHTYAKGGKADEYPLTVNAPIITNGETQEGVQPLLDFVKSIETHSNTAIAEKEAERLQPYFSAVSTYLTQALENVAPGSKAGQNKEELEGLLGGRGGGKAKKQG